MNDNLIYDLTNLQKKLIYLLIYNDKWHTKFIRNTRSNMKFKKENFKIKKSLYDYQRLKKIKKRYEYIEYYENLCDKFAIL